MVALKVGVTVVTPPETDVMSTTPDELVMLAAAWLGVPLNDRTVPIEPDAAAVKRPWASTVRFALVYDPGATVVFARDEDRVVNPPAVVEFTVIVPEVTKFADDWEAVPLIERAVPATPDEAAVNRP